MYQYYNAHPRGLITDDCVKRAIAVAAGMDYREVQRQLNRYKAVTGARKFNTDRNPHQYVEKVLRARILTLPKNGMTAEAFCREHPAGRFILDMGSHWSCCVEGILYDTWDVRDSRVCLAYQVTAAGRPALRNCCTAQPISDSETVIEIYDGNGISVRRRIPSEDTPGYLRCLQDQHYPYVKL